MVVLEVELKMQAEKERVRERERKNWGETKEIRNTADGAIFEHPLYGIFPFNSFNVLAFCQSIFRHCTMLLAINSTVSHHEHREDIKIFSDKELFKSSAASNFNLPNVKVSICKKKKRKGYLSICI